MKMNVNSRYLFGTNKVSTHTLKQVEDLASRGKNTRYCTSWFKYSVLAMMLCIGKVDVGWGQLCRYSNPPLPPTPESLGSCHFFGGDQIYFLNGVCGPFLPNGLEGATITFTGDLTINEGPSLYFKDCVLLFEDNIGITLSGSTNPAGGFYNGVTFDNCILKGCDGGNWKGIRSTGGRSGITLINNTRIYDANKPIESQGLGIVTVDLSHIYNTDIAIIANGLNTTITSSTLNDCNVGLKSNVGSDLDNRLKVESTTFNVDKQGIWLEKNSKYKSLDIVGNTFNANSTFDINNIGIFVDGIGQRIGGEVSFALNMANTFNGLGTAIKCTEIKGVRIANQVTSNCGKGIELEKILSINNGQDVSLETNTLNVLNSGVRVMNSANRLNIKALNNTITNVASGVNPLDWKTKVGFLIDNALKCNIDLQSGSINSFFTGLKINNVSHNSFLADNITFDGNKFGFSYSTSFNTNSNQEKFKISRCKFLKSDGIYAGSLLNAKFTNNTFTLSGGLQDINLTNPTLVYIEKSILDGQSSTSSGFNIYNGSATKMCCNTITNNQGIVNFSGTNTNSDLKVTRFIGSNIKLENSMIGEQYAANNKWYGAGSTGTLINADPKLNQFWIRDNMSPCTCFIFHKGP